MRTYNISNMKGELNMNEEMRNENIDEVEDTIIEEKEAESLLSKAKSGVKKYWKPAVKITVGVAVGLACGYAFGHKNNSTDISDVVNNLVDDAVSEGVEVKEF